MASHLHHHHFPEMCWKELLSVYGKETISSSISDICRTNDHHWAPPILTYSNLNDCKFNIIMQQHICTHSRYSRYLKLV